MYFHRLEIEAGRWVRANRVPVNERKCVLFNVMEDEYYFVLEYQRYIETRQKYITKYYWQRPSMHKFIELINSDDTKLLRTVGSFVYQAF